MIDCQTMDYETTPLDLDMLRSRWPELRRRMRWEPLFMLPAWLDAWWCEFGEGSQSHILEVKEDGDAIGIAPLRVRDGTASLIGSADVCDYMDFVAAPGKETSFFNAILDSLPQGGITELQLDSLRHDSTVMTHLADIASRRGLAVTCEPQNVSLDIELPATWDGYFLIPSAKQGREVRRKLRRLHEAGDVRFNSFERPEDVPSTMDVFLKLLRESREDKATFMNAGMESFFRSIARRMAAAGYLRLGILQIDSEPVAAVMCFDYNESVYLYNSGYDIRYRDLSAGLMSKVLSLKDSIERGKRRYDFLKGAEDYKYRLGGSEIPIYSCRIIL